VAKLRAEVVRAQAGDQRKNVPVCGAGSGAVAFRF
jgi:hypothetical protein